MSAGTILVMSGDKIWMDYSSTLGPIDPQVVPPGRQAWAPALGYLEQYSRLIGKAQDGTITEAEVEYLIHNFDPAELYQYEQARDLSIALIQQWLAEYKFRDWNVTQTQQLPVTAAMKAERASAVAQLLNDTETWHSHSRGISMGVARETLRLQIDDIGADEEPIAEMGDSLRAYNSRLFDLRIRRGHEDFVVDSASGYFGI